MAQAKQGVSGSRKSTTVRIEKWALAAMRSAYAVGFRLMPERALASATRRFLTPRRPAKVAEPEVPGVPVHRRVREVGGNQIVSWTWGEGPEILLLHGWEGRAAQFERLIPSLLANGFRVTAVDLPAHGASSGDTATIMDFARTISAVASERGPLHAVVAHSLGGAATMVTLLDAPIASGAVLLAPAAEPYLFSERAADLMGVPVPQRAGMRQRIEARAGARYEDIDLRHRQGALSIPLLVLHDPNDAEVPLAHGEAVARVSERGRLEALRGLGHRRLLREPSVVERISRFLAEEVSSEGPAAGLATL